MLEIVYNIGEHMVAEHRIKLLLDRGGNWTAARVAALSGLSSGYARIALRSLVKHGLAREIEGSSPQTWVATETQV
jgi:hypothetical protein